MRESRIHVTISYEFLLDMVRHVHPEALEGPEGAAAATNVRILAAATNNDEKELYLTVAAEHGQ